VTAALSPEAWTAEVARIKAQRPATIFPHECSSYERPARLMPRRYMTSRRAFLRGAGAGLAAPAILSLLPSIACGDPIPVWKFGATGDASQDATSSLNDAFSAITTSKRDGRLLMRRGIYQTTARLTTAGNKSISLLGDNNQYDTSITGTLGQGTWFFFNHTDIGLLLNGSNGNFVRDLGSYRPQPTPGVGWAPLAADFDFYVAGGDAYLDNLMMYNATKGACLAGVGRVDLNRIRGQAFQSFINLNFALDTCKVTNCHHWTFWNQDINVTNYMLAHLHAIDMKRVDNPMLSNNFILGAGVALYLARQTTGPITGDTWKLLSTNFMADGCNNGVQYDTGVGAGIFHWFSNLSCNGGADPMGAGHGVVTGGAGPQVFINNFECNDFAGSAVNASGSASYVRVTGARCFNWDKHSLAFPCFNAAAGCTIEVTSKPSLGAGLVSGGAGTYIQTPP
jgi:hypothetical protein